MDKKATGIVAYITIIGWLIAYIAGDKEGAKFHLNQGLVLSIAMLVVSAISWVPVIRIFSGILSLILFIFMIMGIIYAAKEEDKELPLIGGVKLLN